MEASKSIEYGRCHCGCGETTNIPTRSDTKNGSKKGVHNRYVAGHHARNMTGVYNSNWKGGETLDGQRVLVRAPSHHRSDRRGYVRRSILVAEVGHGPILSGNVVHHEDRNESNDSPDNLLVFQTQGDHRRHHARERAREACGHPEWRQCGYCHQ